MAISEPILVYLGANALEALEEQLLALNVRIKFVESAIYPERPASVAGTHLDQTIVRFDANIDFHAGEIGLTRINAFNHVNVIEAVMNDKQLPLLWTRFGSKVRWCNQSEVKRYEVAYSLIKSAIETILREKPTVAVFAYEPHMLPMYVFKKVCEELGIRTHTLVISPFNWRLFVDTGDGAGRASMPAWHSQQTRDVQPHESVTRFIDEKKSDYSVAKPFYEKRMITLGPARRLLYELRVNGWAPHRLFNGWLARSSYRRLSTLRSGFTGSRYICFFLQLQPEQTTLPDGGLFVHHLFAIQMLYSAVAPLGISLVVREHPATFEYAFNRKWRPGDFYESIKRMGPGIYFDDLSEEPYSLIRNAVAVSAITGTVLLEGLLQGRPAIAFGKHPLKGHRSPSFVDKFDDEVVLRQKISAALAEPPQAIVDDTERYMHLAYTSTFGTSEYEGNANMSLDKLRHARNSALLQLIGLLSDEISSNEQAVKRSGILTA